MFFFWTGNAIPCNVTPPEKTDGVTFDCSLTSAKMCCSGGMDLSLDLNSAELVSAQKNSEIQQICFKFLPSNPTYQYK